MQEVAGVRGSVQKLKQELLKMKILQKLSQEREQESASEESTGMLDWHRHKEIYKGESKIQKLQNRPYFLIGPHIALDRDS